MALTGRFESIRSYDGTRIACTTWGSGTPVILSNGICCSDTHWTFLAPYLAEHGCRVVFFDYRGHLRSGPPHNPNEVTLPCHARDLWTVADHYEIHRPILIGHSMGVQTVFEAYRQHPHRTRALVALAGPFEYPLDHLYLTPVGAVVLDVFELTWRHSPTAVRAAWWAAGLPTKALVAAAKLSMAVTSSTPADLMEEYVSKLAQLDPLLVARFFRGMQMHSARDVLPRCDVPVLQLAGGRDVLTPLPVQRELAALLPDVQYEVFPSSGHTLPIDEPDRCNERVLRFIDELRAAQPTEEDAA